MAWFTIIFAQTLNYIFCMRKQINILLFMVGTINLFGQTTKPKWSMNLLYLPSEDISIIEPDLGDPYRYNPDFANASFEVSFTALSRKYFIFETGYRYKQHWLSSGDGFIGSSSLERVSHSIPVRVGGLYQIPQKYRFFRRFTLSCTIGQMLDILTNYGSGSRSRGLYTDPASGQVVIYDAIYSGSTTNNTKFSMSTDIQGKVAFRMWKRWSLSIGRGYTSGDNELARGRYTVTYSGPVTAVNSGNMYSNGRYSYWVLGLQYNFKGKE
jgi:hypothetical protein